MKILIATFLLITTWIGQPANDSKKTIQLSNDSVVSYSVDDSGNKKGAYIIKNSAEQIIFRGSYNEDKRVGDWYCFGKSDEITLRYNYTLGKLIVFKDSVYKGITFTILDKTASASKNASVAIPIYPVDDLKALIASETLLQMPNKLKSRIEALDAQITVFINEKGDARYEAKYIIDEYQYKSNVVLDAKNFKIEWLPASFEGKQYKCEAVFKIKFKVDGSNSRRFLWNF